MKTIVVTGAAQGVGLVTADGLVNNAGIGLIAETIAFLVDGGWTADASRDSLRIQIGRAHV